MITEGCDISSHQGSVEFDELAKDTDFVLAKATEGTGFTDPYFSRNWEESRRVGLVRGAYHFARPDLGNTATAEADWFLGVMGSVGGLAEGDLLALDYEADWDGDVPGWCLAFLERVRSVVGFRPLLYLNLSLVNGHDWSQVIAAGYGLWLAYYDQNSSTLPQTPWQFVAMKQYTSSGILFGIADRVDRNTFFGTQAQLELYGKPREEAVSPIFETQTASDVLYKLGDPPVPLEGVWRYPSGVRTQTEKVYGLAVGHYPYFMYPKVDPDADETRDLSAVPAIFVITVVP